MSMEGKVKYTSKEGGKKSKKSHITLGLQIRPEDEELPARSLVCGGGGRRNLRTILNKIGKH